MKRVGYILIGLLMVMKCYGQVIMSYNVENLFHPAHDTLKQDYEYTPDGIKYWNNYRYYNKLHQIAKVIANINDNRYLTIIGLQEIENEQCLIDLCRRMPHYPYKYLHYESRDERGIDVAMLYDSVKVKIIHSEPLIIQLDSMDYTRDILYACAQVEKDTLHILVCHLPSQLGGAKESEWKREKAKAIIQHQVNAIIANNKKAKIIVMGDFNSAPKEDITHLYNQMLHWNKIGRGTHKYKGQWTCLDQFYVSESLLDVKTRIYNAPFLLERDKRYLDYQPKRTYKGYRYNRDGYSDHLPILLYINE